MARKAAALALLPLLSFCLSCGGGGGGGGGSPAKLLLTEDFNTCSFNPAWNGSFVRYELYPPGVQPFVEMPGHGCVLQQYVPQGVDEVTSAEVLMEGDEAFQRATGNSQAEEFYVEWQEFFPDDHDFADGSQKLMRFTYWRDGDDSGPGANLVLQTNNSNVQLTMDDSHGKDGSYIDLFTNTERSLPTGRWVDLGVWVRLNTPGDSDGFAKAYMDGEEIVNMENISNRGEDWRGFNVMWVGGNHTNQKNTVKASNRYIDNIRWYDRKP